MGSLYRWYNCVISKWSWSQRLPYIIEYAFWLLNSQLKLRVSKSFHFKYSSKVHWIQFRIQCLPQAHKWKCSSSLSSLFMIYKWKNLFCQDHACELHEFVVQSIWTMKLNFCTPYSLFSNLGYPKHLIDQFFFCNQKKIL